MTNVPASLPERLADAEGELDLRSKLKPLVARALLNEKEAGGGGFDDLADAVLDCLAYEKVALVPATILARLTAAESARETALACAERAETGRDAGAAELADELEGWLRRGFYRPGDHLPSSWQHDLGGRIARNMRLVLRALRSCPDAALTHRATAEET